MLKILVEKWDKNKDKLRNALYNADLKNVEYIDIVKLTFDNIYNVDNKKHSLSDLDMGNITEINDGEWQGTLLYLIPFKTYQPAEDEYLMTYVGYGSCSGCDTLQSIQSEIPSSGQPTEANIKDFMVLCKDIICNTIKPYNYGWHEDKHFETVEVV